MVLTVHNSDFASYAAVCFTLNCFNVHIRRFGYVHVHRLYMHVRGTEAYNAVVSMRL